MPAYDKSPFHQVKALVAGIPAYLFGSWPLTIAPSRFLITQVSLTTNVAQITGSIIEGNIPTIPAAGQPSSLISIRGTQSNGGLFNVTNVAISAVSINSSTGVGTISFPLTNANIGATADAGLAIIPQPETAETTANGASLACTMPVQDPKTDSARTINAVIEFPSLPTAAVVDLQAAQFDQDSEYQKLGNVATVSAGAITGGPAAQFTLNQARFFRFNVSGLSGGPGTIIGRILV